MKTKKKKIVKKASVRNKPQKKIKKKMKSIAKPRSTGIDAVIKSQDDEVKKHFNIEESEEHTRIIP
jgi:hypothetical protein